MYFFSRPGISWKIDSCTTILMFQENPNPPPPLQLRLLAPPPQQPLAPTAAAAASFSTLLPSSTLLTLHCRRSWSLLLHPAPLRRRGCCHLLLHPAPSAVAAATTSLLTLI